MKADFSASEWQVLRDAPHLVVIAVATAGGSGLFGSLKEAMAPAGEMIETLKGNNHLLRDVCDKDEVKAAIEDLKDQAREGDFQAIQARFRKGAIDQSKAALDILLQKATPDDVKAYTEFLTNLGNRVANAAKEGSFLGFGGERVSENERTLLTELAQLVDERQA